MKKKSIKEFRLLLKKEKVLFVDFYADWCEPCKLLNEILKEVQAQLGKKIHIIKIDVDASKELSDSYNIMSVPVLILFKNEEPIWRMNGFLTAEELIKIIEKKK